MIKKNEKECIDKIEMSNIKCIIFDLDYTLVNYNPYPHKLYDDVIEILTELKKNGYKIALASYNAHAPQVLKRFNIYKYFDYIEYEDVRYVSIHNLDDKKSMLEKLLGKMSVNAEDVLFIDDQRQNINAATALGINVCLVNKESGISKDKIKIPVLFKRQRITCNS